MKRITNEIPNEIKMPVYWVEDENGTLVFDLDEMADTLTDRISTAIGIDVHISILELEENK